ncbi:hypothetical protein VPH35_059198 [Triticum aestivum]
MDGLHSADDCFSPRRAIGSHYMSELLQEHQKLVLFTQVLPICIKLLGHRESLDSLPRRRPVYHYWPRSDCLCFSLVDANLLCLTLFWPQGISLVTYCYQLRYGIWKKFILPREHFLLWFLGNMKVMSKHNPLKQKHGEVADCRFCLEMILFTVHILFVWWLYFVTLAWMSVIKYTVSRFLLGKEICSSEYFIFPSCS